MKAVKIYKKFGLILFGGLFLTLSISAQEIVLKQRERLAQAEVNKRQPEEIKPEVKPNDRTPQPTENASPKDDSADDVAAITNYYSNYMTEYRLGPEDVISVQVFGQCPDYCKEDIVVPPTAMISYPLIREGVFVGGKTIEQVTEQITRSLDEYIIDPKVTVSLIKVGSARYGVIGKVEKQGTYLMTRKISVFDAIAESGGISKEGDKSHAVILRPNAYNRIDPIMIDLKEIQEGRAEMAYLKPGDQVLIPKQGFNFSTLLDQIGKFSLLRILLPF